MKVNTKNIRKKLLYIIIFIILISIIYNFYFSFFKPYVNLDFLTSDEKIKELNHYLLNEKKIYNWPRHKFIADKQVHSDKIMLTTCKVCENFNFYNKRFNKGNSEYHIPNQNYYKLSKLINFIKELNIFEDIGETVIIINEPNVDGIEHHDHEFDLVSEFIWIRTNNLKKFNVKDKFGISHTINNNIIWFDDRREHNISPINSISFSIRVNGKFKPDFRRLIANENNFYSTDRKKLLLDQH
tara:strand:- start:207 stop:929 length:723 start_codon:yes stop_codon:yes gene_type:complete